MRLKEITPGLSLTGVEPTQIVSVVATVAHGDGAISCRGRGARRERFYALADRHKTRKCRPTSGIPFNSAQALIAAQPSGIVRRNMIANFPPPFAGLRDFYRNFKAAFEFRRHSLGEWWNFYLRQASLGNFEAEVKADTDVGLTIRNQLKQRCFYRSATCFYRAFDLFLGFLLLGRNLSRRPAFGSAIKTKKHVEQLQAIGISQP